MDKCILEGFVSASKAYPQWTNITPQATCHGIVLASSDTSFDSFEGNNVALLWTLHETLSSLSLSKY